MSCVTHSFMSVVGRQDPEYVTEQEQLVIQLHRAGNL